MSRESLVMGWGRSSLVVMLCVTLLAAATPAQTGGTVVKFGANLDTVDAEQVAVERKLRLLKVSLSFEEASLIEVVQFLRQVSGLNIILDPIVLSSRSEDELQLTLDLKDLSLENCLNIILDLKDLKRRYQHGVLILTVPEAVSKEMFFKIYDVRDLMFVLKDFPGPVISLAEDEQSGINIDISSDDDSSNPFSDEDTLLDLIKANVAPESWDEEHAAINLRNGILIVTSTREVQLAVRKFLDELRASR